MEDLPVFSPRLLAITLTSLLLLAAQPGQAKTYKWVDENGVTQYTQTPPPKGDFDKVKAPPKPAITPEEAKRQLQDKVDAYDERRTEAAKSRDEANKKKAEDDKKAADCDKAKQNLAYFESKPRIKYTDKDGNAVLMPEDDRQKKMQELRDNIKKHCK